MPVFRSASSAGMSNTDYILVIAGLVLILWLVPVNSEMAVFSTASESLETTTENVFKPLELTTGTQSIKSTGSLNRPVLGGDCDYNIDIALQAIGGPVVIKPGQSWSFDDAIRPALNYAPRYCAGVLGGAWCNLAATYSYLARQKGLAIQYISHGIDLGYGMENSTAIWLSETTNDQDLVITNNTSVTVVLEVK